MKTPVTTPVKIARALLEANRERRPDEGAAVLGSLLVMLLMAAMVAGFTALVITDTRVRALDSTRTQAFYSVHAGLEKLTADLGDLFSLNVAPTGAQINALMNNKPNLGVTWTQPDGTNGYKISFNADGNGNPVASVETVGQGPYQGLVALATSYTISATGHVGDGSERSLTRTLQTVAIPVFQFGIFSENDLSFFAGPDFNFGGRVHTNSNLFLAEGDGKTLTLADRVTAVGDIVRTNLSNGWAVTTNYNGTVKPITAPNAFRNLQQNEGSLVGTLGSAQNQNWIGLSTGTYNHNIMNGRTGARRLDLPITQFGATPIDLIRRPAVGEDVANPNVLGERFYTLASLRILLSDTAADITSLPGIVTATPPIQLGTAVPAGYTVSNNAAQPRPPFAQTNPVGQAVPTGQLIPQGQPLLGGFLKIEKQTAPGVWTDVTLELLSLGFASPAYNTTSTGAAVTCADLFPNAVIRLQRVINDTLATCLNTVTSVTTAANVLNKPRFAENVLFDPREGQQRDAGLGSMQIGGLMYYVELDAKNLSRWFAGTIPAANCPIACSGNNALNVNGYTVYFSDRRGNQNGAGAETAEYGFEDIVNPASGTGAPNGALDTGEDFNGNGTLETYGATAHPPVQLPNWAGISAPYASTDTPETLLGANGSAIAQRSPPIFFRRALKLTDGAFGNLVAPGLTIASENPVYIQGNWNASAAGFGPTGDGHVATAVLADSVTLLSNNWNDLNSLANPYLHDTTAARNAVTTWYRLAIIAGKGLSFPQPAGTGQDFGTDGGAHNFLRYIEDWGGQTLNYRGSIASLYYSRQAIGTYKCCSIVYQPPTRGYNFDVEFLTPALLPPRTPMFRDVNVTGFAQVIRPN